MPQTNRKGIQGYPRIEDEKSEYFNYLDDTRLQKHPAKISKEKLDEIIRQAVKKADAKSSRGDFAIPENAGQKEIEQIYRKGGKELFDYLLRYYGDPASSVLAYMGKTYTEIGNELYRNKMLQKERMNSGWRYQYMVKDLAIASNRFESVLDIGTNESDFNVTIRIPDSDHEVLTIYVSIKNRENTMGGQDWPKAIEALETMAKNDKNREKYYLCVFGFTMQQGKRKFRMKKGTQTPYSYNTELWSSNFLWPFFSGYTFEEITKEIYRVLRETGEAGSFGLQAPPEVLEMFGEYCRANGLLDEAGRFSDAGILIELITGARSKKRTSSIKKKQKANQ